jgi:monolysocardiolipin acyltransferase
MDSLLEHDADLTRPPWSGAGRSFTLGVVSGLARVLLRALNTLTVDPADLARFRSHTLDRPPGVGLLTYSNHTSTFDEPGLPSALLPWSTFWTEHFHGKMRWTLCARDVCFLNDLLT